MRRDAHLNLHFTSRRGKRNTDRRFVHCLRRLPASYDPVANETIRKSTRSDRIKMQQRRREYASAGIIGERGPNARDKPKNVS